MDGQLTTDNGRLTTDNEPLTTDHGRRTTDNLSDYDMPAIPTDQRPRGANPFSAYNI